MIRIQACVISQQLLHLASMLLVLGQFGSECSLVLGLTFYERTPSYTRSVRMLLAS